MNHTFNFINNPSYNKLCEVKSIKFYSSKLRLALVGLKPKLKAPFKISCTHVTIIYIYIYIYIYNIYFHAMFSEILAPLSNKLDIYISNLLDNGAIISEKYIYTYIYIYIQFIGQWF